MPKIHENPPKRDLSIPELRVLRALAGGACLTLADVRRVAGAAQREACNALLACGLVTKEMLDLDGAKEISWRITEAGERCLASSAEQGSDLPQLRGGASNGSLPRIGALVQVFGSNRLLGPAVGQSLAGCEWVGIPFCGGLSEVPHIKARTLLCADAHAHIINLSQVVADELLEAELEVRLESVLFHDLTLAQAQQRCWDREAAGEVVIGDEPDVGWAFDYFCTAWMGRAGQAGTNKEFQAPLSIRWNAGGGDSVKRFRNAAAGLRDWLRILAGRATFVCMDAFEFLAKVKDLPKHGIFIDPPFINEGSAYKHKFDAVAHARLAGVLGAFRQARVVQRCYDCPAMRTLYSVSAGWRWQGLVGKRQTNSNAPEALILKNES